MVVYQNKCKYIKTNVSISKQKYVYQNKYEYIKISRPTKCASYHV